MPPPPRDRALGRSLRSVPRLPVRPTPARSPSRVPRAPSVRGPSVLALVLWPAAVSLAVTLLRLVGELRGWSPEYFGKVAGGGLAIVGITWLVPLVGGYLGFRLVEAGLRAPDPLRLAGWPLLVLLSGLLLGHGVERWLQPSWTGTFVLWAIVALPVALASFLAWPALGRPLVVYALAARLPVIVIMGLAIWNRWGTHYDAPPPGFPGLFPLPRWLWTGVLPQTTVWVAYTLAIGAAGAAVGAWLSSLHRRRSTTGAI